MAAGVLVRVGARIVDVGAGEADGDDRLEPHQHLLSVAVVEHHAVRVGTDDAPVEPGALDQDAHGGRGVLGVPEQGADGEQGAGLAGHGGLLRGSVPR
jgi:hypothetical protein